MIRLVILTFFKKGATMSTDYQIIDRTDKAELTKFLAKQGQFLLPLLDSILTAETAVDEVIDVVGRSAIEAILLLSAQDTAGHKHQGKRTGDIRWHGKQTGLIPLGRQKIRVVKPRLRDKNKGEVAIPAYEAMLANSVLGQRLITLLMRGISTRAYKEVVPEMAETVGVSKSSVSREFIEATEKQMAKFAARSFADKDILVIYIDGIIFGDYHVIASIGVDSQGYKHVLGLIEGVSENAAVVKDLLNDIVSRGIQPGRRRLFVLDGSKAIRAAITEVYGSDNPIQRCRTHKITNVMDHLPENTKEQVKAVMKAAYRLDADEGIKRIEQQARQLEILYPSAAASLREGLQETFTVRRMCLPPMLVRSLQTTNIIESPYSGVRMRTRRVCRWQDGTMVLRWATTALLATEQHFRRISGHAQLWTLKSYLDQPKDKTELVQNKRVG
jgi:putative transposase